MVNNENNVRINNIKILNVLKKIYMGYENNRLLFSDFNLFQKLKCKILEILKKFLFLEN